MSYIYTTQPHPTRKGQVLAIAPKPDSWRCLTDTEKVLYAIGGTPWNKHRGRESVAYTLSKPQARDLDLILRAGFRSECKPCPYQGFAEPEDRMFWHPDHGDREFTRAEAMEVAQERPRCRKTLEMDLAPPTEGTEPQTPTRDAKASSERWRFKALYREARRDRLEGATLYAAACRLTGDTGNAWPTGRLHIAVDRALAPVPDMRRELARRVLNGWGSRYGMRAPAMTSPRFENWRKVSAQADALRQRLEEAGRLVKDAGNWVQEVRPPTRDINATDPTEEIQRLRDKLAAAEKEAALQKARADVLAAQLAAVRPRRQPMPSSLYREMGREMERTVQRVTS